MYVLSAVCLCVRVSVFVCLCVCVSVCLSRLLWLCLCHCNCTAPTLDPDCIVWHQGLAQAEASRVRLADAMQNIGKKGNDGSATPSKGGSGHTTIDRDMAHLIDSFVHAVNAIDGMVDDVSHAFTSRRKSALDKASSEAFAALRYLRAGVDGLASRVRAANMRTTPQEVVAAQSSLQHVADLQSKMAAAPKVCGCVWLCVAVWLSVVVRMWGCEAVAVRLWLLRLLG